MNIGAYMSDSIGQAAATILKASAQSLAELRFVTGLIPKLRKSAKLREKYERLGTSIPPYLICSISSQCNLRCAGCYARAFGECGDEAAAEDLSAQEWESIFAQAEGLGVSVVLLAGGEPLLRRDVIGKATGHKGMVFPVFTNGIVFDDDYFALFDRHRNLIPVLSVEGDARVTDERRGEGVYDKLHTVMGTLSRKGIFYGASITVTSGNLELVTSNDFIGTLQERGCGIVFFVEYVPALEGSEVLTLSADLRDQQEKRVHELRMKYSKMVFVSFPGDEKLMGGCLAAGRGFIHINPAGGAEPCPFSPFSDTSLKTHTLLEALISPLFNELRLRELLQIPHTGGCALFAQSETVSALIDVSQKG